MLLRSGMVDKFGEEPTVRLLRQEIQTWQGFVDALRGDDKALAQEMMEKCMKYVEAVEQSGKDFLTEPFFLTILLDQAKQIRAFEIEMQRMQEEVTAWRKGRPEPAGSAPPPKLPPEAQKRLG